MGLIAQAKADIEAITSNADEFGIIMVIMAPLPLTDTVTLVGLHTKHYLAMDTEGNWVNVKNAHISFSEKFLTDANYPVRNSKGEVALINHKIDVKDSTGIVKHYIILQSMPDETVGLIVCILGDFE